MYFNGLGHNALTHVEYQKKHKASPSLNLAELADFLHVKEKVNSVAKCGENDMLILRNISVRDRTEIKNKLTICILTCGLFLICRG
jgi:hypothetical protein